MNEKTHTQLASTLNNPTWWNETMEKSWKDASAGVIAAWDKVVHGEKKLEQSISRAALAFGHGAKEAYPKMTAWSADLEEKLKADWKHVHTTVAEGWENIKTAVKHGFEAAKQVA